MKTLKEIKNEVAKSNGFDNWKSLMYYYEIVNISDIEHIFDEVSQQYAIEQIKKHLEIAAENAKLKLKGGRSMGHMLIVDKESITNIKIELT